MRSLRTTRLTAADEAAEKVKLKKASSRPRATLIVQALQQGNTEGARIYASNAIRKKTESLNLLRLSSRVDAVSSRVETAVAMRSVTSNMTSVVKNMDRAMASMNLEQVRRCSSGALTGRSRWSWRNSRGSSRTSTCRPATWRTRWATRRPCRRRKIRSTRSCSRCARSPGPH